MKDIAITGYEKVDESVWLEIERDFKITVRGDIKDFISKYSGGHPIKDVIIVDGEEYEVRVFLSLNPQSKYYYIVEPMRFFLQKTNGKIVPIAIDSGDNYYCANNETGKVYYWSAGQDMYYCIAESLEIFAGLFNV